MAHVYQMQPIPGVEDMLTLMAFLGDVEKYKSSLSKMLTLRDEINALVEASGKVDEIAVLHARATADRQEAEATIGRARESAMAIIQKAKDDAFLVTQAGEKTVRDRAMALDAREAKLLADVQSNHENRAILAAAADAKQAAETARAAAEQKSHDLDKLKKVYEDKLDAIRKAAGE